MRLPHVRSGWFLLGEWVAIILCIVLRAVYPHDNWANSLQYAVLGGVLVALYVSLYEKRQRR